MSLKKGNFLTDEVGDMLDFLIYITYFDEVCITKEDYELIQEINVNKIYEDGKEIRNFVKTKYYKIKKRPDSIRNRVSQNECQHLISH